MSVIEINLTRNIAAIVHKPKDECPSGAYALYLILGIRITAFKIHLDKFRMGKRL